METPHDPHPREPPPAAADPVPRPARPRQAQHRHLPPQVRRRVHEARPERHRQLLLPRHRRPRPLAPHAARRRGRRCPRDPRGPERRGPRRRGRRRAGRVEPAVHGDHARRRRRRPVHRPHRIPLAADHPLGRPALQLRRRLRRRQPDGQARVAPVRLQQRLPRHHPDQLAEQGGAPRRQPRVHEREHHVPARRRRRRARRAAPHRQGLARHVRRRAPPQDRRPAVDLHDRPPPQPPHHRGHALLRVGPGRGIRVAAHQGRPQGHAHPRHARQLRRRHHPVGHRALRRGELQRLLPHRGHERLGQALRPRRQGDDPRLGGHRPPLRRPHRRLRERAEPLRLDRRGRPVRARRGAREAHRARPLQARGRERDPREERPRRRVHGRRRALRLPLQVRLARHDGHRHHAPGPQAEQAAAHARRALRGALHGRLARRGDHGNRPGPVRRLVRRHRPVDPARDRRRLPGPRLHHRGGARAHAPCRRRRRRHEDGPLRGRPAQPRHRQDLRRLHQQHRPWQGRQGGRHGDEPADDQPRRPHRGDHRGRRRRPIHHLHVEPAARRGRPGEERVHLLLGLPEGQGLAHQLPGQRRVRLRGQPLDLDRRRPEHHRPQRRPVQGAGGRRRARARAAVPLRAHRGRDLRAGRARHRGHGVRRGAAPGRGRLVRRAALLLPRLRARARRLPPAP